MKEMAEIVDVAVVAATTANVRVWQRGERMGLAAMLSDHHVSSSEDRAGVSEDTDGNATPSSADSRKRKDEDTDGNGAPSSVDSRKRKEASAGKDVNANLDHNKRNKHVLLPEYSGESSDSMSNSMSTATPGKSSLMMQSTKYAVPSPQRHHHMFDDQGTFSEVPGAAKGYNTSGWSTDHDNNGDDECSGGHATSTFASSEEGGSSQHLQYCDPFLRANRSVSAFDRLERQVKKDKDEWLGGSSNLNWQLGSFINKEKQKLESSSSGGSSGGSKHSMSGSLQEYGSMGPPENIGRRSSESSASMSSFPGGSSTRAESSQPRHPTRITQPNTVSSTLLLKTKTSEGMKFQPIVDVNNTSVMLASKSTSDEDRILLTEKLRGLHRSPFSTARMEQEIHKLRSHDLHQKFVLSSGRLRQLEAVQNEKRTSTIDRDFDEYFAKLML